MPVPVAILLAFAGWTLLLLVGGIGTHRVARTLGGQARASDFPADQPHGPPRYRRVVRAHANCVENLPVYGAVVLALVVVGAQSALLDALACVYFAARVGQSSVHVAVDQTHRVVLVRFSFFVVQLACVIWMGMLAAWAA
jgi:uncharacterized MAPEG superfamily protein